MYRSLLYFFTSCLFLTSCNDHLEIEANNDPQGYADSQVVGAWKITALISDKPYDWDGNGTPETDIYNSWSACDKDHLYTFVGDKTGVYKINCSTTLNGVWQIFEVRQLEYTPDGMSTLAEKIVALTSNEFKTTRTVSAPSGQIFTLTKTWTRQ
ncbi:MAG TPA: hypothetical protein VFZ42_11400 [Chitinophagaceae bacterium]